MFTPKRAAFILSSIFVILLLTTNPVTAQVDGQVFMSVEEMPQLHGDLDSLHNEMEYPREAWDKGIEGKAIVQFVVTKEGKTKNLKVIRGLGGGVDEEAKRLIKEASFTPGKQRGEPVNVRMSMSITFDKSEYERSPDEKNADEPTPQPQESQEEESDDFFIAVEDMPELKGGLGYLQKKLEYPEMARKAGIEGRVIVQFIVNKQGEVENPRIIRGIGGGCDKEAMRVLKEEAEFEPGRQRGEPVRVQYSLPLTFQLQDDDNKEDG